MSELKNVTYNTIGFTGLSQINNGRMDNQQYENDRYLFNIIITICSVLFAIIVGSIILLICYCRIYKNRTKKKSKNKRQKSSPNSGHQNDHNDNNNDNISVISHSNHLNNQTDRSQYNIANNLDDLTNININDHASIYIDLDSIEIDPHENTNDNDLPRYNDIFLKNYQFV
jgi:hypothetical protein